MRFILLLGAVFNIVGALPLFRGAGKILATPPGPADRSLNLMLFAGGTAFVFASLYVYLFFHPLYVIPFLIFGAALKTWAFLLSLYLLIKQRTTRQGFLQFGVGNGVVALFFWVYLATLM